jgi:hypothetical protein
MKRFVHSLLALFDLKLVRASAYRRTISHFESRLRDARREAIALRNSIGVRDGAASNSAGPPENVDNILESLCRSNSVRIGDAFADICTAYSGLVTAGARQRVSEHIVSAALWGSLAEDIISTASKPDHELVRQAQAASSYASSHLADSQLQWERLCAEIPSSFNLTRLARVNIAMNDLMGAFATLADGLRRYPDDLELGLEQAIFFRRLGDVANANASLSHISHLLLRGQHAMDGQLPSLQATAAHELKSGLLPFSVAEQARVWETSDAELRLSAHQHSWPAIYETACNVLDTLKSDGQVATVVEFATVSGRGLSSLAKGDRGVRFFGVCLGALWRTLNERTFGQPHGVAFLASETIETSAVSTIDVAMCLTDHHLVPLQSFAEFLNRCRELGARYVVATEPLDFDLAKLRFGEPGTGGEVTVNGASGRPFYDTQGLLEAAGYRVRNRNSVAPSLVCGPNDPRRGHTLLVAELQ